MRAHSTIAGVTTSAPAASPSHQVTQIGSKFSQAAKPATHSVTTPTVALMTVAGPTQTKANFATRAGLVKVSTPRDQWMIRYPPTTASSVLPAAISAEVSSVPAVVALAAKAPIKNRRPDAQPAQKDGGERDAGRRPDRAGARIDRGELQAELGEDEIADRDRDQHIEITGDFAPVCRAGRQLYQAANPLDGESPG